MIIIHVNINVYDVVRPTYFFKIYNLYYRICLLYIVYEIVPIYHLMNNKVHPSFYTVLIKVGQNVITGEMIFYTLPVIHICVTLYPVLHQI